MYGFQKKLLSIALAMALVSTPAWAWGPKADTAIVVGASRQLMKSANVPLKSFSKELQQGASLPRQSLLELYPTLDVDVITAIESEMALLQSVRGDKMDPFYAYRLGALGKLVALATSPMQEASGAYRDLFFADVEQHIEGVSLTPKERRQVSPRDYFRDVIYLANQNNELIERSYQNGSGYEGVAASSMPEYASKSVDAVTDVWYTILSGKSVSGGLVSSHKESYVLDGFRFYIDRGNRAEISASAQRLEKITGITPEMRSVIAGYYYDAEMYDKAIEEYEFVLALDPSNKEAQSRIAAYYMMKGDESLEAEKYEEALKSYIQAANANPINSRGEEMRLHTEQLIAMRNENYDAMKAQLQIANQKVDMAESEAHNRRYAEAIALMSEAITTFNGVGDQFPDLAQEKITKVRRVAVRMEELRLGMMQNVRTFSGMGFAVDVDVMAKSLTGNLEQDGLKKIIRTELDSQLAALEMELSDSFAIK